MPGVSYLFYHLKFHSLLNLTLEFRVDVPPIQFSWRKGTPTNRDGWKHLNSGSKRPGHTFCLYYAFLNVKSLFFYYKLGIIKLPQDVFVKIKGDNAKKQLESRTSVSVCFFFLSFLSTGFSPVSYSTSVGLSAKKIRKWQN